MFRFWRERYKITTALFRTTGKFLQVLASLVAEGIILAAGLADESWGDDHNEQSGNCSGGIPTANDHQQHLFLFIFYFTG
ncbi:MAG TPA: hypothetical protein VN426_04130 [Syntrophomonadaceae bacterium]|nr:hypothetical protein [Syntrophomonadaceae bacterium]